MFGKLYLDGRCMSQNNKNLHDTAALRALAGGEDWNLNEASAIPTSRPASPGEPISLTPANDGNTISQVGILPSPAKPGNPMARNTAANSSTNSRNGTTRYAARQNAHAGIHFRKTIIPLLLAMAIVLIGLGVFTLTKVNNSSPEAIAKNPILDNGTLFAGVSITLGMFLIAGSLFFQYEIKKHHRQNSGGKK